MLLKLFEMLFSFFEISWKLGKNLFEIFKFYRNSDKVLKISPKILEIWLKLFGTPKKLLKNS